MKSFRLVALSALLTVSSFCAVIYSSCSKDACKGVTCQNGGTCSGGNCTCATGYEGTSCETKSTTKFVKIWSASDNETTPTPTSLTYSATVVEGSGVTDLKIAGFSNAYFVNTVAATVSGNNVTIATQTPDNDGYAVSGTGVYDATTKKITWTYSITQTSSGQTLNYTGTWQ